MQVLFNWGHHQANVYLLKCLLHLFILYVHMWLHELKAWHVWKSEDNSWHLALSLHHVGSGMKLKISSDLAASVFIHWPALPQFLFYLLICFCKTGSIIYPLAVLELTMEARLASNSQILLTLPPKCWVVSFFKLTYILLLLWDSDLLCSLG